MSRRILILKRLSAGYTQTQIAELLGISIPAVSRYVRHLGLTNIKGDALRHKACYTLDRMNRAGVVVDDAATRACVNSTSKPPPDLKPKPKYLAAPFDPPPDGCRYYVASKRALCGAPKLQRGHYCAACRDKVSPLI